MVNGNGHGRLAAEPDLTVPGSYTGDWFVALLTDDAERVPNDALSRDFLRRAPEARLFFPPRDHPLSVYVFVAGQEADARRVARSPLVERLMLTGKALATVTTGELQTMLAPPRMALMLGQTAKVLAGDLAGLSGQVVDWSADVVTVLITLRSRKVLARCRWEDIEVLT